MLRSLLWCGGVAAAFLLIGFTELVPLGRSGPPDDKKTADSGPREELIRLRDKIAQGKLPNSIAKMHETLAKTVSLEKGMDTQPLQDALDWFRDGHDLTVLVDQNSFTADLNIPDVVLQQVKLPKLVNVRLDTVLEKVVSQVQGGYLVKSDHIVITSAQRMIREIWGDIATQVETFGLPRPMMRAIHAAFDKQPLANVLQELSDMSGTSVVLDGKRIGDKGQTAVSGQFNNVPLDTAVRLLANQAGLRGIVVDNTILVTTEEHSSRVLQEQEKLAVPDAGTGGAGANNLLQKLQQPLHLNFKEVPLHKVLQNMSKEGELPFLLDPRLAREGQTPITLQLAEVSLDTAARLIAEMVGLKPVLIGNVVFVTSEAAGTRLQNELQKGMNPGGAGSLSGICGGLGGMAGFKGTTGAGLPGSGGGNPGIGGLGLVGGFGGMSFGGAFGLSGGLLPSAGAPKVIGSVAPSPRETPSSNAAKPVQKPGGGAKLLESRMSQIQGALAKKINLFQGIDPTPLKEALEYLREKSDVLFLVDNDAFKADLNIPEVELQQVKLPKMKGVRLSTILEQLCFQVDGNFLVRADHFTITSRQRWYLTVWGSSPLADEEQATKPRLHQAVNAGFGERPLDDALRELMELTGISIILDPHRAGEKAKGIVTARFTNVPIETAVRLMADQAGLQATVLDNVLYITTGENARAVRAEHDKANQGGFSTMRPGL